MSARTQTPPTDTICTLAFVGPTAHAQAARAAVQSLGFQEVRETIPWRECFPACSDAQLPGMALAGARTKEGLTQVQLARLTGIPQRHISEMEHSKRLLGRNEPRSSLRS
jgi:hypothetical protein